MTHETTLISSDPSHGAWLSSVTDAISASDYDRLRSLMASGAVLPNHAFEGYMPAGRSVFGGGKKMKCLYPPLLQAAKKSCWRSMNIILDNLLVDPDVQIVDSTPIFTGVVQLISAKNEEQMHNTLACIRILLDRGATPTVTGTPLLHAMLAIPAMTSRTALYDVFLKIAQHPAIDINEVYKNVTPLYRVLRSLESSPDRAVSCALDMCKLGANAQHPQIIALLSDPRYDRVAGALISNGHIDRAHADMLQKTKMRNTHTDKLDLLAHRLTQEFLEQSLKKVEMLRAKRAAIHEAQQRKYSKK